VSERYEKFGASVRVESSARGRSTITLREGGFAVVSDEGSFSCGSLPPRRVAAPPTASSRAIEAEIEKLARRLAVVERVTVVEGRARHKLAHGSTTRRWEDASARVFVTLVRPPCGRRASIALGATSLADVDLIPVSTICQAFARPESPPPPLTHGVTLEPWVAASFVRAMADKGLESAPGLHLEQQPPKGSRDGRGNVPRREAVRPDAFPWPDCFRPSYRFAPAFVPLHVALGDAEASHELAGVRAVALASHWIRSPEGLVARAWLVDAESSRVSLGELAVAPGALTRETVTRCAGNAQWFPEGAGAWGERLTLTGPALGSRRAE
jgi:hypothetical protein